MRILHRNDWYGRDIKMKSLGFLWHGEGEGRHKVKEPSSPSPSPRDIPPMAPSRDILYMRLGGPGAKILPITSFFKGPYTSMGRKNYLGCIGPSQGFPWVSLGYAAEGYGGH